MPEGHTIHRLARHQTPLLAGQTVRVGSPQGRFAAGAAAVDGRRLERIEPYGKHLFYWFEGEASPLAVHVHLGLYGRFRVFDHDGEPPAPVGAVRMRMTVAGATIDLSGPSDCSLMDPAQHDAVLARLGPDPIRRASRPERALARIRRSGAPVGTLLLDQSIIAGVGNVYRAEALFVNGIAPLRRGRDLAEAEAAALWTTVVAMLRQGVRDGRIVTVAAAELRDRSWRRAPGGPIAYVYGREHCRRCGSPVGTVTLGGRTCYFCPVDQR